MYIRKKDPLKYFKPIPFMRWWGGFKIGTNKQIFQVKYRLATLLKNRAKGFDAIVYVCVCLCVFICVYDWQIIRYGRTGSPSPPPRHPYKFLKSHLPQIFVNLNTQPVFFNKCEEKSCWKNMTILTMNSEAIAVTLVFSLKEPCWAQNNFPSPYILYKLK